MLVINYEEYQMAHFPSLKELCLSNVERDHDLIEDYSIVPRYLLCDLIEHGGYHTWENLKLNWKSLAAYAAKFPDLLKMFVFTGEEILAFKKKKSFFKHIKCVSLQSYNVEVLNVLPKNCLVKVALKNFTLKQINLISQPKILDFEGCKWFRVEQFSQLKRICAIQMSRSYLCSDFFKAPFLKTLQSITLSPDVVEPFEDENRLRNLSELKEFLCTPVCSKLNLGDYKDFFGSATNLTSMGGFIKTLPPKMSHVNTLKLDQLSSNPIIMDKFLLKFLELRELTIHKMSLPDEQLISLCRKNPQLSHFCVSKREEVIGDVFCEAMLGCTSLKDLSIRKTNIKLDAPCSVILDAPADPISMLLENLDINSFTNLLSYFVNRSIPLLSLQSMRLTYEAMNQLFSAKNLRCLSFDHVEFPKFDKRDLLSVRGISELIINAPKKFNAHLFDCLMKFGLRKLTIKHPEACELNYLHINELYETGFFFENGMVLELEASDDFWRDPKSTDIELMDKLQRRKDFYMKNCFMRNNLTLIILD